MKTFRQAMTAGEFSLVPIQHALLYYRQVDIHSVSKKTEDLVIVVGFCQRRLPYPKRFSIPPCTHLALY